MKNFFFSGVAILGLVSLLFVFFEIPTKGIVSKDIKSEESPRIYKERSAETYNKIKKHIKERKTLKQLKSSTGNYLSDIEELGPNINGQIAYGDGNVYGGYVYDLEIHGDTWVAATETGGAWISFTAGDLWDPIDDDWAFSKLETVLRDPLDLNRYYFGGPRGTGLFYWDSNGNTLGTDEELIEWTGTIDGEPNLNFTSVDQLINAPFSSDAFYLSGNASEQSFSTAVFRHQNGAFEKISSNSFILDFEVLYDGTILYLQRSPTFKSVEVVKITMNGNDFSEEIIATLNYDDDITLNKAQIAIDKSNPCNESTIFVSVNKASQEIINP